VFALTAISFEVNRAAAREGRQPARGRLVRIRRAAIAADILITLLMFGALAAMLLAVARY